MKFVNLIVELTITKYYEYEQRKSVPARTCDAKFAENYANRLYFAVMALLYAYKSTLAASHTAYVGWHSLFWRSLKSVSHYCWNF